MSYNNVSLKGINLMADEEVVGRAEESQPVDDPDLLDTGDEVAAGFEVDNDPLDGNRRIERLDIEDVVGVDLGEPEALDGAEAAGNNGHE